MNIKHLEVKRAYYADPENVVVQYQMHSGCWYDWISGDEPSWYNPCYIDWRIKPKTIRIGDLDVPEPVRKELGRGTVYYIPDLGDQDYCTTVHWAGDSVDTWLLARGLIHLTQEAAELHAKALILVSGGKIDE